MSKTFKSSTSSRQLDVTKFGNGDLLLELYPDDNVKPKISAIAIAPSDAPALCLAILKAAGGRDAFGIDVSNAMTDLREYVKEQEREAAAEADRVALEAEALVLHNAFCSEHSRAESFDEIAGFGDWLAVARAARELNKEAGQ